MVVVVRTSVRSEESYSSCQLYFFEHQFFKKRIMTSMIRRLKPPVPPGLTVVFLVPIKKSTC